MFTRIVFQVANAGTGNELLLLSENEYWKKRLHKIATKGNNFCGTFLYLVYKMVIRRLPDKIRDWIDINMKIK